MVETVNANASVVNVHQDADASRPGRRLPPVATPTDEERNAQLRSLLRALVAEQGGQRGKVTAAMGIPKTTLNGVLSGHRNPGLSVIEGIARMTRRDPSQVLAAAGDLEALRAMPPITQGGGPVTFGDLPNWLELQASAKAIASEMPVWVWESLAQSRVWLDVPVTPALVADLAAVVRRNVSPPPAGSLR